MTAHNRSGPPRRPNGWFDRQSRRPHSDAGDACRRAASGPARIRATSAGIGVRFGLVAMPSSLLVPLLWLRRRRQTRAAGLRDERFPAWMDDVWISMLALDLAGNVFDLYDRQKHFDLIPHAHGTGALTVTVARLLQLPPVARLRSPPSCTGCSRPRSTPATRPLGSATFAGGGTSSATCRRRRRFGRLRNRVRAARAGGRTRPVAPNPRGRTTRLTGPAPSRRDLDAGLDDGPSRLAGITARSAARRMKSTRIAWSISIDGSNVK